MDSDPDIAYDYSPRFRVYKNGRIERLVTETFVPPSLNPENGVISKDAVYSPEKNLSLRIYLPHKAVETRENEKKKKLPLLVYFHGGAFIMETDFSPVYHAFLTSMVSAGDCIAVSVDYRRAPEHPIPIADEDSWDAINADFSRVFIAGANIAHHMGIRAGRDRSDTGNFKILGMTLFHPYFFSKAPIDEEQEVGALRYMEGIWKIACPNSEKGVEDPWISVVGSDLSKLGCGRVLAMVAGNDVLAREGRVYAAELEKSGWQGKVEVMENEGHVFHIRNPDSDNARVVVQRFAEFLRDETSCW